MFSRVDAFVREIRELETEEALAGALAEVSRDLGFRYFALTHHVDVRRSSAAIRIHNYPDGWAEWFDDQALGSQVRLSHQIEFAFIRDAEHAPEPFSQQVTGGARSLNGKVEQMRFLSRLSP